MTSSMRVAVLTGSVRPGNSTNRAADVLCDELARHSVSFTRHDPADLRLPFPGQEPAEPERLAALQDAVGAASGVLFVTPEYHGSFSSVTKAVIDNLGFPSRLAGKPVALAGVAAGSLGAVKALEHLRSVLSHVGALVLPGPVSVAGVREVFGEDGSIRDAAVEKRLRGLVGRLLEYLERHVCPLAAQEADARVRSAETPTRGEG